MDQNLFPTIDTAATGRNIQRLRKESGLTVRDLQDYFGFEDPQAIYRWQWGRSLPSVDNLYALSALLHVSMNDILVPQTSIYYTNEKTAEKAVFSCIFFVNATSGVDTNLHSKAFDLSDGSISSIAFLFIHLKALTRQISTDINF